MNNRQPIIVVVDPDADRATSLSSRLDRRGYHVVRRSSGTDALQCVAEYRPDLVLSVVEVLDIERPELIHSIREISPSTQVLLIPGQGSSPPLPEGDGGADGGDEVVHAVDRLFDRTPSATF